MTALLVIAFVAILVSIDLGRLWLRRRREAAVRGGAPVRPFAPLMLPRGLFLDHSHTWVRLVESGEMRLGVDELLAQVTDGADRLELPAPGVTVRRGEPIATIWRRGRRLPVPSPVSGTVVTSNHGLLQYPRDLAEDPYGAGWLTLLWPTEHREALKPLQVGEAARKFMNRELERLKEFLSVRQGLALADGAQPVVGAALHLDDKGWEEFGREFAQVRDG
jgi:glycine cleavage system H lipoate-binding protein